MSKRHQISKRQAIKIKTGSNPRRYSLAKNCKLQEKIEKQNPVNWSKYWLYKQAYRDLAKEQAYIRKYGL